MGVSATGGAAKRTIQGKLGSTDEIITITIIIIPAGFVSLLFCTPCTNLKS
jgi:hypothetical protein